MTKRLLKVASESDGMRELAEAAFLLGVEAAINRALEMAKVALDGGAADQANALLDLMVELRKVKP